MIFIYIIRALQIKSEAISVLIGNLLPNLLVFSLIFYI
jgi:hypothetical protein